MKSKWLQQHETEVEKTKVVGRKRYIRICIIAMIIPIVLYILGLINKMSIEGNVILTSIILVALLILVIIYRICYNKGDRFARKRLERILKTQEEVDQFDQEMTSEPLFMLKMQHKAGKVIFTEHYMMQQDNWGGPYDTLRFIKRDDVASLKVYISDMIRPNARVCDRKFSFVCSDNKDRVIGYITLYRKVDYQAVKEGIINTYPMLTKYINEEIYYDPEVYDKHNPETYHKNYQEKDQGGRD